MKKANVAACLLFLAYGLLLHWPRPLQVSVKVAAGDVPELDFATVDFDEQLNRYGLRHAPTGNNLAAGLFETVVPPEMWVFYATPAEFKARAPRADRRTVTPSAALEATAKAFEIELPIGLERLLELPHDDGIYGFMYGEPWTEDQVPLFAQWLDDHQELLDEVQQLCERDHYFQYYHGPGYTSPLPLIQVARDIKRALLLRSNRALGEDRLSAAAKDILSILRLGTLFSQGYFLFEGYTGATIHNEGCLAAARYLSHPGLTLAEIRNFQQHLAQIPAPRIPIHAIDIGKRFLVLSALQAAERGGLDSCDQITDLGISGSFGIPGGELFLTLLSGSVATSRERRQLDWIPPELDYCIWDLSAAMVDWKQLIQRMDSRFDKVVEILKIEDRQERTAALAELDRQLELFFQERTRFSFTDAMDQHLSDRLLPKKWSRDWSFVDRAGMARSALEACIAIRLYQLKNGEYPESLDVLLGNYLEVLPEDVYVNRPMRYLKMENRALLYSVGHSKTDHGGWGPATGDRGDPLVTEVGDDLVFLVGDNPGGNNISAYRMLRDKQREVIELSFVDVESNGNQDTDLWSLTNLDHLQTLTLSGDSFTDAGLVHLKGLISLKELALSSDKITDAGLVHLKGLTNLSELSLYGTQVTDAGLLHLKGLTGLRAIGLTNTKVTDAGVAKLQKALPTCEIEH